MELVHIGGDTLADAEEIIAILSRETVLRSRDTRRAMDALIGKDRIRTVSDAPEKSYVITLQDERSRVYASPISAETLGKRAERGIGEMLRES
ncbi:MAG: DUF370 domain-containing protein [Clostridiales bacterium]|nr:DUF370 domain-containing protein [Clostridiales bacterium]